LNSESCPLARLGEKVVKTLSRSEVKREAIVNAACSVFLCKGFDIASMDLIAAEANVSKKTVYGHFQSKENLFFHIMIDMCSSKLPDMIMGDSLETSKVLRLDRPIEESLAELGDRFLTSIFQPDTISLLRILIGQADKFPEIGRTYFRNGPEELISVLSAFFKLANDNRIINVQNPDLASQFFLAGLLGRPYTECLAVDCDMPDEKTIKSMVKNSVDIFLNGTLSSGA